MARKTTGDKIRKAVVPLGGVNCSSCVARLENGLAGAPGIAEVSVNLTSKTAFLTYDVSVISQESIRARIEELGYKVLAFSDSPVSASRHAFIEVEKERSLYFNRFLLAFLLTALITGGSSFGFSQYTLLSLSILVWAAAGRHFHEGFLKALKSRSADMNSLVSLSTSVTLLYGAFSTLAPGYAGGHHQAQWHELGMLITFINFGRWLEVRSRAKAGAAVEKLLRIAPKFARRLCPTGEETVALTDIRPGDKILLRPGEQVPADGIVSNGSSSVDESLLTGEPLPSEKAAGSHLFSGTYNKTGWLEFTAEGVGEDTALMRIARSVQESQTGKTSIQRLVDRISAWFVPLVFGLAACAAVLWLMHSGPFRAVSVFAAVLAVACPCAMGLAVPMAVAVGFDRAASLGILIRNTDILERVSRVDVVIFDKTGTITEGKLKLLGFTPFETEEPEFLRLLAAVEEKSEHPFAEAVRAAVAGAGLKLPEVLSFEAFPGKGVKARVREGELCAGSLKWMDELAVQLPDDTRLEIERSAEAMLLLSLDGKYKGLARLGDSLRPEAAAIIKELVSMGIEPVIASGDRQVVVAAAAVAAGVKTFHSGVFPEEKRRIVMRYKALGKKTVMVGDGFNDAPALSEADIGISMRSGTDIAAEASDITLMRNDLRAVVDAIRISRRIKAVIGQNLLWAFVYNVALLPVAAGALYPFFGVLLAPHYAGAAMALSSVSVVMNSLRLKKMKI